MDFSFSPNGNFNDGALIKDSIRTSGKYKFINIGSWLRYWGNEDIWLREIGLVNSDPNSEEGWDSVIPQLKITPDDEGYLNYDDYDFEVKAENVEIKIPISSVRTTDSNGNSTLYSALIKNNNQQFTQTVTNDRSFIVVENKTTTNGESYLRITTYDVWGSHHGNITVPNGAWYGTFWSAAYSNQDYYCYIKVESKTIGYWELYDGNAGNTNVNTFFAYGYMIED